MLCLAEDKQKPMHLSCVRSTQDKNTITYFVFCLTQNAKVSTIIAFVNPRQTKTIDIHKDLFYIRTQIKSASIVVVALDKTKTRHVYRLLFSSGQQTNKYIYVICLTITFIWMCTPGQRNTNAPIVFLC